MSRLSTSQPCSAIESSELGGAMNRFAILLVGLAACGCSSSIDLAPDHGVVLSEVDIKSLTSPCSRAGAPSLEAIWRPKPADIESLEGHLRRLTRMRAKRCCLLGARVRDINLYYRQYVGIVSEGKRLIYINAYASIQGELQGWKTSLIETCDGGADWGAVYDPATGRFSHLSFNGLG